MWITGGMDGIINLWDIRFLKVLWSMKHGDPVNAVLCMPGGGLLLSAGGNEIKVWDILGGGRLVRTWSNHQKTITSLCLDGTENRILSAGLDGHENLRRKNVSSRTWIKIRKTNIGTGRFAQQWQTSGRHERWHIVNSKARSKDGARDRGFYSKNEQRRSFARKYRPLEEKC